VSWLKRGRDKKQDGADPLAWVAEDDETRPGDDGAGDDAAAPDTPAPTVGGPDDGAEDHPAVRQGPWDVSEVDASDAYVDLGGLWIPGRNGMELRLEVEEESGRVIAVTIQLGDSAVQLQAFAAPRSSGIWDEIRKEIASSVSRQGGTADEVPGPFGRELLARVPTRTPEGRTAHQPARFAGVDGPRWFLRAVFHGEAAYQADKAVELEELVRQVVVVRGSEAMAPRELLSLRLPESAGEPGDGAEADEGAPGSSSLRPPERGPEISEVR
jgi:Protein of unknown function (DUF3710)